MLTYIRELKPTYKIGLISNASAGKVTNNLSAEQLALFDAIIVSAEVGMLKPDPKIFIYGAEKLEVKPEECVFIDDHEPFLKGAKVTGMKTVHFKDIDDLREMLKGLL